MAAWWMGPALVAVAYLVGSISFAILVARRAGVDLYAAGSGNPGATNVGRLVGKPAGRTVLILDALKGALPFLGARLALAADSPWTAAVGLAAVVGHCVPIWHGGRGGKGAATAAGVMLVAEPLAGGTAVALYFVLKRLTGRASVGSLAGAAGGAAVCALLGSPATWMAAGIAVVVWVRHADNLARLVRGEEPAS